MTLSAASAAEQRSSSAKLEALLAKLAVRKLELDRAAAEARVAASESDASDDEPILSPAPDAVVSSEPRTNPGVLRVRPARHTASVYGSKAYWDARYGAPDAVVGENLRKGETNNEWYVGWRALRPYALDYALRSHRVLLLGIGTSTLGEEMSADGFSRVTAVDYSEPAIERMRKEQENRLRRFRRAEKRGDFSNAENASSPSAPTPPTAFEVDYRVMDVTRMTFADNSFDCVLDKATLDTMCQLDDDDDEEEEETKKGGDDDAFAKTKKKSASSRASRMLRESCRALRPGGTYVCVTYGAPSDRMDLFLDLELDWDLIAHREIPKNKTKYHLYALRRRGGVDVTKKSATDIDASSVVDVTSLEVIRVGNSTAAIPLLRDPFHGSALDMRDRPYRK
jgi:SAM-dependent methyltransferase